ncbi:MAG: hypothetical protein WAM82_10525 [Thermoanaerobaculia bacterium]
MNNRIYDGVLINLLQKGRTTGSLEEVARQFMEPGSISARYKQTVRGVSIEDFSTEDTLLPQGDEHRRLFHWHYKPRVYKVFGFFDLAILQLCDSVELISELSTQRNISATQNIFGLRTCTASRGGKLVGTLEVCSPLLPYLFICNVKVHPLVQMLVGKDLQSFLNLHWADYLDEIEVLGRAADPKQSELITIAVIDTFGWNELTLLIHGSSFDRMFGFVWNRIRALRLEDLVSAPSAPLVGSEELRARFACLAHFLEPYGFDQACLEAVLPGQPVFSHTETIPCLDYGIGQRLCQAPPLAGTSGALDSLSKAVRQDLLERLQKNSFHGRYLDRGPSGFRPALDQIIADMQEDRAGCLTGFSILPGGDKDFHRLLSRMFGVATERKANAEVVLGQYDAFLKQFREPGTDERLLSRLQRVLQIRFPPSVSAGHEGRNRSEDVYPQFNDLVVSSKTALTSPVALESQPAARDAFEILRQRLPRLMKFKGNFGAETTLIDCCRRIQMPKPIQISLEHTIEPFHSFLQNPGLFSQYIDLFLPLLLITRQIERAASGHPDDHRPVAEHVSRELRQFNHAFQARFQSSHLQSESTEPTLEFKAHTVTPLDTIQCIIDCFTRNFVGFDIIAGFPLISVSSRPQIHVSRVFSVELNSFHLLYPESLLVLFHELGHLYLRYRGLPRSLRGEGESGSETCVTRMLKVDDEHTSRRWAAFTSLMAAEEKGNPVDSRHVVTQAEEILSDLLLLTGVCRGDWTLFFWYMLTQIESLAEYFPEDAPPGDPEQAAFYREIVMRLFFVDVFRRVGSSDQPHVWAEILRFERLRELTDQLRSQSKKIRDFCAKNDPEQLDYAAWKLVEAFARPAETLSPRPSAGGIVWFQANDDFWSHEITDVRAHRGLPSLFISLLFVSYRWMLEDLVSNWLLAEEAEQARIEVTLDIDLDRLRSGTSPVADLETLLRELVRRDWTDPTEYLEKLRSSPSSGWEDVPFQMAGCWPAAYRRVTKALYALVRYFHAENTAAGEELRYLYRDPATGLPEKFQHGRSDVPASPCYQGEQKPLPIVIDRRGVFFCRSTATRQRAFQYRNAVIRELADLHARLRPAKLADILTITESSGSNAPKDPF